MPAAPLSRCGCISNGAGLYGHRLPLARHQPRPLVAALRNEGNVCKGIYPFVDIASVFTQQVHTHTVAALVQWQSRQVKADAGMALRVGGLKVSSCGQGRANDLAAVR